MELEFHQLDRRYEALKRRALEREKRLLSSLADHGQQTPIVVVKDNGTYVVVDGFKRVRALLALKFDTIRATEWTLSQIDALLLERVIRGAETDSPIEQAWLLRELKNRFDLSCEELGQRFEKSASWVSRRLALLDDLPAAIESGVRDGKIAPHAAMKYFVPLARANIAHAERLFGALGNRPISTRQMGAIYAAWRDGTDEMRESLASNPWLFLRAQSEKTRADDRATELLSDIRALGRIAQRLGQQFEERATQDLSVTDQERIRYEIFESKRTIEWALALAHEELIHA